MQVVFVCTGNICRSPMAEAIARADLGDGPATFASAGTISLGARRMTREAAAALEEIGVPVPEHRSRRLDRALVRNADVIAVMEPRHRAWIERRFPEAAARVVLLDPAGSSVPDPYGSTMNAYRLARDQIRRAVAARREGWTI